MVRSAAVLPCSGTRGHVLRLSPGGEPLPPRWRPSPIAPRMLARSRTQIALLPLHTLLHVLEAVVYRFDGHGGGRIAQPQHPDPVGGSEGLIMHEVRERA
jgi:hypothetical protein